MSDNGYLQPRPADYDLDTRLKSQNGQSRPGRHPGGGVDPKGRFDSGVADLEMHRMSNSPRPKSSAMYEYIDSGSHYEDVPGTLGRSVSGIPNGGHDVRQSTVSDSRSVITDVTSDTDDTATIFKISADKKKRYNPLYEPNSSSAPNAFARNKMHQQVESLERHIRVQCVFLFIISLVAIAALALSLYLVIFQVFDQNTRMLNRVRETEERTKILSEENEQLKLIVTAAGFNTSLIASPLIKTLSNTSEAILSFEEELNGLSHQMTFTQQNLSQRISDLTTSFDAQLLNISKMPGPQGPPGVGNLSACAYVNYTSTTVASPSSSSTIFNPTVQVLQTKVVMFAACAVIGGTTSSVVTNAITTNMVQYKCVCDGQTLNHNDRTCILHLLLCPRETVYSSGTT